MRRVGGKVRMGRWGEWVGEKGEEKRGDGGGVVEV